VENEEVGIRNRTGILLDKHLACPPRRVLGSLYNQSNLLVLGSCFCLLYFHRFILNLIGIETVISPSLPAAGWLARFISSLFPLYFNRISYRLISSNF
jgi:hypothetical protein